MRVATWNVNSVTIRLPKMLDWLQQTEPDVLCLQELKNAPEAYPEPEFLALGYESAINASGRWNGVAVMSRVGLRDVQLGLTDQPEFDGGTEPRAVGATCGGVRLWSVYVPNGREPANPHFQYKLEWLEALRHTITAEALDEAPFAVLGDFNVAPTDADVWDPAAFVDSTHVTEPERAALAALRDLGLTDVFPRPLKHDYPFTYWDYRGGNFHKNIGMRIDLVYANHSFAAAVTDAYVDREARKGSVKDGKGPSDHAPVVVDLSF